MRTHFRRLSFLLLGVMLALSVYRIEAYGNPEKDAFNIPVDYYKLKNGLKVVLSEDKTSPTVVAPSTTTSASCEPKDRKGFAHPSSP